MQHVHALVAAFLIFAAGAVLATDKPDCNRPLTLALHDHGLLYSSDTGTGIDKDVADELIRRSGCKIRISVMPRARIWQLIESGALDFSLSGITNAERERFAGFAWYFANKYYLLVRRDAGVAEQAAFERQPALRLGAIRSFRYSSRANALVDRLIADNRVTHATGLDPLYQLLLANRIQGMIIEPFDYPAITATDIRALSDTLEFGDPPVPHGLIMSRVSVAPGEQQKWRDLIDAMRADGTILRIFQKYFNPDMAQAMVNF